MGLSKRNNWVDKMNRVYVYFTVAEICELLSCRNEKAVKLLAELDAHRGIGLIERVKQGQGKPTKIYIKKFVSTAENPNNVPKNTKMTNKNTDFGKTEVKNFEKPVSGNRKNRFLEMRKSKGNNTEYSKLEFNQEIDIVGRKKRKAKKQIEYDILNQSFSPQLLSEMVELMV